MTCSIVDAMTKDVTAEAATHIPVKQAIPGKMRGQGNEIRSILPNLVAMVGK